MNLLVGARRYLVVNAADHRSGQMLNLGGGAQSQQNQQSQPAQAQPGRAPAAAVPAGAQPQAQTAQATQATPSQSQGVNWETSNPKVATVEQRGNGSWVRGVGDGTASIEATFIGDIGDGQGTRQHRAGIAVIVSSQPHRSGVWIDVGEPPAG